MHQEVVQIADIKVTLEIPDSLYKELEAFAKTKKKTVNEVVYFALIRYGNPYAALNQYIKWLK